jgi:hypothetical protein
MQKTKFTKEQRALHKLIVDSIGMSDIGLFDGKMGIILSLITYSRKTKHKAIEEVADFLMNQVLNNMTNISPLSFTNGLTGIGWGIEYLIQKGYMPGCGADICSEIDKRLMSCDIRRVDDFSLEHGIYGWLHYIVAHIQGANRCGKQVFDRMYIIDLISKINEYSENNATSEEFSNLQAMFREVLNGATDVYKFPLEEIVKTDIKFSLNNLSLSKGLAGYLITKHI